MTSRRALAMTALVFAAALPLQAQESGMHQQMHSVEYLGEGGLLTEAVRVGNTLYLSGKLGTVPGEGLVDGGIGPETTQTMENIKAALERYGSSMDEVVKCTVFLANMEDYRAMNQAYLEYFPNRRPARSAIQVGGLVFGAAVEIECMATVGLEGGE